MTASTKEADLGRRGLDDESRQMVIDTVRQLRKRLLTKEKLLEYDKNEIFPEQTLREMISPEIGLQLLFIPEAYGGMGGGAKDTCAVTREMCKICLGVGTAFFAIQLGADPLMVGGTEIQKQKWLGAIAEGSALVAYAVTEPNAGSNLAALKTKAEPARDEAGEITGYVINGSKQFISTGGYADFVTLLADTPDGPSFFVIEKGTPGFDQGKGEEKHGIRASNTSPLSLNNVFVPKENLIGDVPGKGLKQANKVFGYTRLMVAAMALGGGETALSIAISYAKERIQFGSPLSEKQAYTHKLIIPHVVRLGAADTYIDEVADILDTTHQELQVEGSISKLFTTESANKAADDAMQALGGYGYITEFEIEKIKRDVKITCIYEGTSEIQQNIIGTFRWKKSRKSKGRFYGNIAEEMFKLPEDVGSRFYALAADALNKTIDLAHNNKIIRQQYILFLLADMMTYVEVGAATARRAANPADMTTIEAQKIKLIARIFANDVAQLVSQNMLKILMGCNIFDADKISDFLDAVEFKELSKSSQGIIGDMDKLADLIFER
jgi:alkylation response protein AidB-like acyl-CoA dehydrogenase